MQRLRSAGRFPTGRNYAFEYSLEIIDKQRNVKRVNIAGSNVCMFAIGRREILEQLDLVTAGALTLRA